MKQKVGSRDVGFFREREAGEEQYSRDHPARGPDRGSAVNPVVHFFIPPLTLGKSSRSRPAIEDAVAGRERIVIAVPLRPRSRRRQRGANCVEITVHELQDLPIVRIYLEEKPDARSIVLESHDAWLEERKILRDHAIAGAKKLRQPLRNERVELGVAPEGVGRGHDLRHVLGIAERELLEVRLAFGRGSAKNDPRFGAIATRLEGAVDAD